MQNMNITKKIFNLFIILIILVFIFFLITASFVKNSNLSIFKIIIISSLITCGINIIYIKYKDTINNKILMYRTVILFEFLLLIGIFGPVFIDRSISYHMVMIAYELNGLKQTELTNISNYIYKKRFNELEDLNLLMERDEIFYATTLGSYFFKINEIIGFVTHTDREYKNLKLEVENNDK